MGLLQNHPERVQIRSIFEGSGCSENLSEIMSDASLAAAPLQAGTFRAVMKILLLVGLSDPGGCESG